MRLEPDRVDAVLLDLGNTLIEFGPRQMEIQNRRLREALLELYGRCDPGRLAELRARQVVAPYRRGFRENDPAEIVREIVRETAGREPAPAELERLLRVREEAFRESTELPEGVRPLLERLRRRFLLGLVSNYPCGRCIRELLDRAELTPLLAAVVVSGEVGRVKPDPLPFRTALAAMGATPERALYVGDNWLADVQGARRLGMQAVHITRYVPYERFEPQPGDHPANAVIGEIFELEELLGQGSG